MEVLAALIWFGMAGAIHAIWVRLPFGRHRVHKFVVAGVLLGATLLWSVLWTNGLSTAAVAAIISYAFICELYLFLFTLVGSSISVRLLLKLRDGPLGPEAVDEINDCAGMVERRMEQLVAVGLLTRGPEDYQVSGSGRKLVAVFRVMQQFFRHAKAVPLEPQPAVNLRNARVGHKAPSY